MPRANRPCRVANHSRESPDWCKHDAPGSYLGTLANLDIAQDLGPCSDQHAAANLRVAIAGVLASTPKSDPLQQRDIVINNGRLTDYDAGAMIKKNAPAQAGCRVNVDCEHLGSTALKKMREMYSALLPEHVADPVDF